MPVGLRARQVRALLVPTVRVVAWTPLAGAAALAVLAATVVALGSDRPAPSVAVVPLRLAAIALGAGGAFAMVDRMGALPVPTPHWLRQWLRVVVVGVPVAAFWYGLATAVRVDPSAGLAVEALVCGLVGFAAAAFAARHRHTTSAALAGVVTQSVLVVVGFAVPARYSPWAAPGDSRWGSVHRWWWLAAAATLLALLLANRDPVPAGRGAGQAPSIRPAKR